MLHSFDFQNKHVFGFKTVCTTKSFGVSSVSGSKRNEGS